MPNLLRAKQVAIKRGCSRSKLYADIAEDKFPNGIVISPRYVVWDEADVDRHIRQELQQAKAARG